MSGYIEAVTARNEAEGGEKGPVEVSDDLWTFMRHHMELERAAS